MEMRNARKHYYMWKLLPVCLLVSCAANDQQQPSSDENQINQARIVRQLQLPVESSAPTIADQPSRRTFQRTGLQGWLDDTGAWRIRMEVHHHRFRCGSSFHI